MTYRYICIDGKPILWTNKKQVCVFGTQKLRPRLHGGSANLLFTPDGRKKI